MYILYVGRYILYEKNKNEETSCFSGKLQIQTWAHNHARSFQTNFIRYVQDYKIGEKKNFLNNTILWHIILSNYLTYDINLMVGLEITELRDPTHRSSIPEINFKHWVFWNFQQIHKIKKILTEQNIFTKVFERMWAIGERNE